VLVDIIQYDLIIIGNNQQADVDEDESKRLTLMVQMTRKSTESLLY
jgi:hypothetical protein